MLGLAGNQRSVVPPRNDQRPNHALQRARSASLSLGALGNYVHTDETAENSLIDMPLDNAERPNSKQAPAYGPALLGAAVLLLFVAVFLELPYYVLSAEGAPSMVCLVLTLTADACLLLALWCGGWIVRVLVVLCGLVALPNTHSTLCWVARTFHW